MNYKLLLIILLVGGVSVFFLYQTFGRQQTQPKQIPQPRQIITSNPSPSSNKLPTSIPSPSITPKLSIPSNWGTFNNDKYKYKISYPEGITTIKFEDKNCVSFTYKLGVINIGVNDTSCFRSSAAYELSYYSEDIKISGSTYKAKVMVEKGPKETLNFHNETGSVKLANGLAIEYGARSVETATYQDYLTGTKPTLLQILETMTFTSP